MFLQGIEMDVSSNKTLAVSLENAVIAENPYFNTMLRILTTRCMMQAKYFTSGLMSESDFYHYGLAMSIYTHFTSPIRRYGSIILPTFFFYGSLWHSFAVRGSTTAGYV